MIALGFAGETSHQEPEPVASENPAKSTRDRPEDMGQELRARPGKSVGAHAFVSGSQTIGTKTSARRHSGTKVPQPIAGIDEKPVEKPTNVAQAVASRTADFYRQFGDHDPVFTPSVRLACGHPEPCHLGLWRANAGPADSPPY